MTGDHFALTADWGHIGAGGGAVMPGQGRVVERAFTPDERTAMGRRPSHPRRDHLRRVPQPPRLLAQRPRRGLDLQARRLPGPQEMALLPRTRYPRPPAASGGSPTLHRNRPPHRRHPCSHSLKARPSTSLRYAQDERGSSFKVSLAFNVPAKACPRGIGGGNPVSSLSCRTPWGWIGRMETRGVVTGMDGFPPFAGMTGCTSAGMTGWGVRDAKPRTAWSEWEGSGPHRVVRMGYP